MKIKYSKINANQIKEFVLYVRNDENGKNKLIKRLKIQRTNLPSCEKNEENR